MSQKFNQRNDKWKILKKVTQNNKISTPSTINSFGYTYSEPKMVANIMNNFFIQKIINIRNEFKNNVMDPLIFLKHLKPRVTNKFNLPLTNIKEVTQYINEIKNSNSTGHDLFKSKMLKKVKHILAPHITHLINCTIRTSKFPKIFKISMVLPLLKKSKNP